MSENSQCTDKLILLYVKLQNVLICTSCTSGKTINWELPAKNTKHYPWNTENNRFVKNYTGREGKIDQEN